MVEFAVLDVQIGHLRPRAATSHEHTAASALLGHLHLRQPPHSELTQASAKEAAVYRDHLLLHTLHSLYHHCNAPMFHSRRGARFKIGSANLTSVYIERHNAKADLLPL